MWSGGDCLLRREADRERDVDTVETDVEEREDIERDLFLGLSSSGVIDRLRPRSAADLAS